MLSDSETEHAKLSDMYDTDEGEERLPKLYSLRPDADYDLEEEDSEDSNSEGADNEKGKKAAKDRVVASKGVRNPHLKSRQLHLNAKILLNGLVMVAERRT